MDTEQLLQAMSNMMDDKLKPVHDSLDKMNSRLDKVESRLDKMDSRLDKVESRLDKMDSRLDKLESQTQALQTGQTEIRKELKKVSDRVEDTYNLALESWGKSTENREWLQTL